MHADRAALYESIAHATIPPTGREAVRRALPALKALHRARARGATGLTHGVGAHALARLPGVLRPRRDGRVPIHPADGRTFAVTDANVAAHHRV